jgi:glycosyltransferase involved in cell wall biosynthesis
MKLSVYVLSYNKNGWVQAALDSIFAQDYEDYELWVIDNSTDGVTRGSLLEYLEEKKDPRVIWAVVDVPDHIRRDRYVPSWLLNNYYQQATGEVVFYLSDDDLFMPGLFSSTVKAFEENPDWNALYFHLARTTARAPDQGTNWDSRFTGIPADVIRGNGEVDCCIDACQIAYRTHILSEFGPPYFPEEPHHGNHADGIHLQKIAERHDFYPLPVLGVIHRHTPLSTWSRG